MTNVESMDYTHSHPSAIAGLSFFRPESHPDLWGNHSLHHPFLTWYNALIMKIVSLLFTYNSILQLDTRTRI